MNYLKDRLAERDTKLGLANTAIGAVALLFPQHAMLTQMAAAVVNAYFMATPSIK